MPLPAQLGQLVQVRHLGSDGRVGAWVYRSPVSGQEFLVEALEDAHLAVPGATEWFRAMASAPQPGRPAAIDVTQTPDGIPFAVRPYAAPRRRPVWPWLVAAAVVLVLLIAGGAALVIGSTGSTGSDSSAHSTQSASAGDSPSGSSSTGGSSTGAGSSGTPAVGDCRQTTYQAASKATSDSPVVDCSGSHTTLTYYVGQFSTGTTSVKDADMNSAGYTCQQHLAQALGVSKDVAPLTAYSFVWFRPTAAQWATGARWFTCELALIEDGDFANLPTDDTLVPDDLTDAYRACITSDGIRTTCDQDHVFRADAVWTSQSTSSKRPSSTSLTAEGQQACGSSSDYVTAPSASFWKLGDRQGVCWAPDVDGSGTGGGTDT
ncbi:MAG: septum formation family protein [Nocardioides sp.]|uniref:septum formation family protein n=1 Tax=Nocardioides sp. TaxID=35761 RepID=UPI0039E6A0B9